MTLGALADRQLLICPRCSSRLHRTDQGWFCSGPDCPQARDPFTDVAGLPALVDFGHSVLSPEHLQASKGESVIARPSWLKALRRVVDGENTVATRQVARMVDLLTESQRETRPLVLVVGGGSVGSGLEWLYARQDLDLVAFDIYGSPTVQFIADGHNVPLADGSVDGVIVQAVLEHVLEPVVVAAEIERVLRPGGVVYADTPFMQQVHEAAYDFTRFSDSGHRYLFRGFECIESGVVAGAGTALRWSIEYFMRALTRSSFVGRLWGLVFFWLTYADRALDPAHSLDAASSVFFLGRKVDRQLTPAEAIQHYQGGG